MRRLRNFFLCIVSVCSVALSIRAQIQYQPLTEQISSYNTTSFAEDDKGYIWIGTNHGLNRFNGSNYATYYSQKDSLSLNNDNILSLKLDADNNLWISTECGLNVWKDGKFRYPSNAGFNIINRIDELDSEHIVIADRQGIAKINKETFGEQTRFFRPGMTLINALCVSDIKQIWATNATRDATIIYILDSDLQIKQVLTFDDGVFINDITKDNEGNIWITTNDGLLCYDAVHIQPIEVSRDLQALCAKEKIHFLQPYKAECLLIGIADKGMFSYDKKAGTLSSVYRQEKLQGDSYVCFVDLNHNIWLSDKKTGVQFYPDRVVYETITTVQSRLTDPFIKNICTDKDNNLWIRTSGDLACYNILSDEVLFHVSDKIYGYLFIDSKNNLWVISDYSQLNQYTISEGKAILKKTYPFQSNLFSVCEDKTGKIWVTLADKFVVIDTQGNISYKHAPEGIAFSMLYTVYPSHKMFLFTISNGVYVFGDDQQFIPLHGSVLSPNSIHVDRKNGYWIGTYNNGLYHHKPETGYLQQYDTSSGLIDNNIKSIIEDKEGNIWFSTSTHITKYDIEKKSFSYIFDNHFGKGRLYSIGCSTVAPDGTLYFGGSGGITVIHPGKEEKEIEDIPLNFDVILVNGKVYMDAKTNFTLDYRENMITFWYSGLNFESGTTLNYAYKLEGFDNEWIDAGNNKRVAYSNLSAGKYTFKVKVRKLNGEWSKTELKSDFIIKPAPWASAYAICIYWIVAITALFFTFRLIIRWRVQKERLNLSERQKELNEKHIDFVTNVSHEIRTPLSLIYAPLKELTSNNHLNEYDRKLLGTMQRNTDRLMQLTEQILSINKSEKQERKLQVISFDLCILVRALADNFRFIAHEKEITIEVFAPADCIGYFDIEKIQKIISNLISNAIKYTPEKGRVEINIIQVPAKQEIKIEIKDTGIGISPGKRDAIFKRFNRLDRQNTNPEIKGSGIGLHYAQHLAHLHKGHISYCPNIPDGSCFTLTLPLNKAAYNSEDMAQEDIYNPLLNNTPDIIHYDKNHQKEHTLLIVEDNIEVRTYIRNLLSTYYNIISSQDGEEGLECVRLNQPDLIISDVVMPRIDGFELCRAIKENPDYGHIPIILLTAKSDMSNSIKGLDCGADAYVNKPFDPFYLKAVVENLITNRKRIQQIILNLTSSTVEDKQVDDVLLNGHNRVLLEQLHLQLDKNLANEEFNINQMAREMGMSYSSLYAKIKSLTGQTPQTFFITYRMNVAMELLKTKKYTVSEVCYKVGASSISNFSRSFKRQFGIPPSAV